MPEGGTGFDLAEIAARLREPLVRREDGVFRLGLVLNGAMPAGAWMAGALDFLVEALDFWEDRKREDRDRGDGRATVPDHEVRVGIAGGASGGGVCAGLLARSVGWEFPSVAVAKAATNQDNPFWRIWVEGFGGAPTFDPSLSPFAGFSPASPWGDAAIDAAGASLLAWPPADTPRRLRPWLADPFRVGLALTNLRGVPYCVEGCADGRGTGPAHYVDHGDHVLFAVPSDAGADAGALGLRADEHLVRGSDDWARFAECVMAAAASPGRSRARRLSRPAADYDWRGVEVPGEDGRRAGVALRLPAWEAMEATAARDVAYGFDGMDGGALNDRPLALVRAALAGLAGSNPRDPRDAHTSVLILDPCAAAPLGGAAQTGQDHPSDRTAASWMEQCRIPVADLLLALDPAVASRFLLTARHRAHGGTPRLGGTGLAVPAMDALPHHLRRSSRVHDFMAGREDCRAFLMHEFVLHDDNPVFRGFASRHPDAADEYRPVPGRPGWLPIIPVAEHLRVPKLLPDWPHGAAEAGHPPAAPDEPFTLWPHQGFGGGLHG